MDIKLKDCRHGKMIYNTHDLYMGKALDLYGEYSEMEFAILGQLIKPGQVILDIGANIGCHTVFFAKLVQPKGFVFAFEPQRIIFQNLCANVVVNNLTNVFCEHAGLSEQPGLCYLPTLNYEQDYNFGAISLEVFAKEQGEPVELKTVDSFNLAQCHLIKIDVEGMESKVLKGAEQTIKRCRPILFAENDREENSKDLVEQIRSYNYNIYWVITGLFNPNNYFANPENIYERQCAMNILCLPQEYEQHIDLPPVEPGYEKWRDFLNLNKGKN